MKGLIVGCSSLAGAGLDQGIHDDKLWSNRLLQNLGCDDVSNISTAGWSNANIFKHALLEISNNDYDIALIGITAMHRINVNIGYEMYNTFSVLSNASYDIHTHQGSYSVSEQRKIGNNLLKLYNDFWSCLDMIQYINIIDRISKGKVFFVNVLNDWKDNFWSRKHNFEPKDLDQTTKNIIDIDNRDDDDIFKMYNNMHDEFEKYGGIREAQWLNLYESLYDLAKDFIYDPTPHPGYVSQDYYTDTFTKQLMEKI